MSDTTTMQPLDKIWAGLSNSDRVLFLGHAEKSLSEGDRAKFAAIISKTAQSRG
jgi:hypothetical protein